MKFDINLYDENYIALNTSVIENEKVDYFVNFIITNLMWLGFVSFFLAILSNFIELDNRPFLLIIAMIGANIFSFPSKYKYRNMIENNQKNELEILKKYGKVYEPCFTVEFLENELIVSNQHMFVHHLYADISQILSDEKHFFIQLDMFNTIILPIRCLNRKEKELAEFLEKKVPKNIYKKPKFNYADKSSQNINDNPYAPPKS